MASNSKNQDIVELIIKGQDEYSDVSEEVRQELEELATQAGETRTQFDQLERSLDLAETYRAQEAEVSRLARAQAEAKIEVDRLTLANKEAKGENIEVVEALARARAELGSYRTATNRAQKALDKTKDSMRQYGVSLEQVEQSQTEMKDSSSQLADELTELQKKQAKLVSDAREQIQASRDKAQAQQQYNEALRQQSNAMADQFRSYTKQQAEQRKVKAETERLTQELRDLAAQLEKGDISWEDFRRRATDAGRAADLTQKQVAGVRRSLEGLVVSSRQSNQALQEQARETKRVEQATEDYRYELERLLEKYRAGKIDIAGFEKAEAQLRRKMKLNEQQVESTRREVGAYREQLKTLPQAQAAASTSTDKLATVTKGLAKAYAVLFAAQKSVELAMRANQAYTETEDAMLGLQKTTELTATEVNGLVAEMQRLSGDVTSTSTAKLLEIAEAAGRMGIEGAENIAAFTQSIDALSSASGLAGDETAQAIAQILNVTGEAQKNVVGVSSVIAELGNTTATTEEQIVHFAKRLATDTASVRLTSSEVLGMSASFAEMGMQAEGASTVIGRTFRFLDDAVKGGGKGMEDLQRVTGMTAKQIEQAFGQDKVGLFTNFVAGIGRMQDGGETLNGILDDMGIKSDENARILGLMSQRYTTLTENVETANRAFAEGDAHFEEMAKKEAALSSSMQRLQNQIQRVASVVGESFSDDLWRGLDAAGDKSEELEESFAELGETAADVVEQLIDIGETIGGVFEPIKTLTGGVGLLDAALSTVSFAFDSVSVVVNSLVKAVAELGYAWNKFTGDTDDMEQWAQAWEDADQRITKSMQRQTDAVNRLSGQSSRAFTDLRDMYNENRDALARMDEEQRNAVETIINSTGYIEGNDAAYRKLTEAMRRAAAEKEILDGLTQKENKLLSDHIALLRSQGLEEAEALQIAQQAAIKRRQEVEKTGESQKTAAQKAQEAIQQYEESQQQAFAKAQQLATTQAGAWEALGLDVKEVTGALTEQGQVAVTAFETIATSGQASADQIMLAFSSALANAKTEQDVKALEEALIKMGNSGHLMAMYVAEGLEVSKLRAEQLADTVTTALDRSLQVLGVDITKIKTGFTEMGREALDAFDAVQTELKRTGVTGKEAAEITGAAFDKTLARISTSKGLDELKKKLKKAAEDGTISWEEYRKKLKEIEEKYDDLKKASKDSIDAQENDLKRLANQAGKTAKSFKDKASFTESDTAANKENAASTEEQTDSLGSYTHALFMAGKSQKEFAEMGSQMASEFDRIWQEIENEYKGKELPGIPSGAYLAEMKKAETAMNKMAEESIHRWNQQEQAIRRVEAALESGQRMSESVLDGLDLIDSQRLEGVRSAIRSMNEEARQVEESLKGTVASLQQQLADLRGDRERSEQLAHEQQMLKLREQYEEAKEKGGNEAVRAAREAMNLQEQIHQERMKQVREQKQADEARKREQQTAESQAPAADNSPVGNAPQSQSPRPENRVPDRVVRLQLSTPGGEMAEGDFTEQNADRFLRALSEAGAVVK
ncbi:phage tail tape measure protein [Marinobacterium sp. BA1]|uniref:phage tail tape measure protein n=1 Tax=Marinobacterium sp. BA1 TaxID=3138931 RepID=UPI0032E68F41